MDAVIRFLSIALLLALLLLASIAVPLDLFGPDGLERVDRLRSDLDALEEQNRQLDQENRALLSEIHAFHSDPSYIEKVARDELGMVGPDEIIYQFPD